MGERGVSSTGTSVLAMVYVFVCVRVCVVGCCAAGAVKWTLAGCFQGTWQVELEGQHLGRPRTLVQPHFSGGLRGFSGG